MPIDNASTRSTRQSRLSERQLREIRKELLVARAALERLNVAQARQDLAGHLSPLGWLGMLMPGFRRRADVGNGGALFALVPGFLQPVVQALLPLLRRHPLAAGMLSLLLGLPSSDKWRKASGPAKWAGAALASVKMFGLWRRFSAYRAQRRERG